MVAAARESEFEELLRRLQEKDPEVTGVSLDNFGLTDNDMSRLAGALGGNALVDSVRIYYTDENLPNRFGREGVHALLQALAPKNNISQLAFRTNNYAADRAILDELPKLACLPNLTDMEIRHGLLPEDAGAEAHDEYRALHEKTLRTYEAVFGQNDGSTNMLSLHPPVIDGCDPDIVVVSGLCEENKRVAENLYTRIWEGPPASPDVSLNEGHRRRYKKDPKHCADLTEHQLRHIDACLPAILVVAGEKGASEKMIRKTLMEIKERADLLRVPMHFEAIPTRFKARTMFLSSAAEADAEGEVRRHFAPSFVNGQPRHHFKG